MRIGIIFGGQSREREISFAGGRTVYDNLNKNLFTPVPIFVDSLGNFILLDWGYLYKGTIRDFYPASSVLPPSPNHFQVYAESLTNAADIEKSIVSVGRKIEPSAFKDLFDFAFLTLHGPYGEDGNIQGILEWYGIPYSGAGILPSSIGIDKSLQKKVMGDAGFATPDYMEVSRSIWQATPEAEIKRIEARFKYPLVVKAPHQGSSIGVSIVKSKEDLVSGINRALFIEKLDASEWSALNDEQKRDFLVRFTDIREGLGFPILANTHRLHHPEELWEYLDQAKGIVSLESPDGESSVIIESFINGREFSCIVIEQDDKAPQALPPTEIRKSSDIFDYRSKYLPGISRKITPIELPEHQVRQIMQQAEALFSKLHCRVYARLDGFITSEGQIYLNDPNTTSGMLPSSFFFHQAAEIGMNPSQFLTFIIAKSLDARIDSGKHLYDLNKLKGQLASQLTSDATDKEKIRVGVIMGGFSSERHISVESGRNIYEKLSASSKYDPVPIFLTGNEQEHKLYQLPINIMLKDNADDIKEKIANYGFVHPIIEEIRNATQSIRDTYASGNLTVKQLRYEDLTGLIDFAFIALHGRPGEDGAVQEQLQRLGIPYNGSGVTSSQVSINKYETNARLRNAGILVADHMLLHKKEFITNPEEALDSIEARFTYPIIAKPADDGCSSAVKKIKKRKELEAFCQMAFRDLEEFPLQPLQALKLKANEEFPRKDYFLIESLIGPNGADRFLEITGGMITKYDESGKLIFEVFEPSEALASGEVLSLEEKFLAGEGQNITPARFGDTKKEYDRVAKEVKAVLEKTARTIEVEGYCRIDAFVRIWADRVETVIIEINSLPGMTPATAIFHQSAIAGMKPFEFIDKIIAFGFGRNARLQKAASNS